MATDDLRYVRYDRLDDGTIVRITLNRPEARNAQNRGLLADLDRAFIRAEEDDNVRVVVLSGAGPLFSAGHDLGSPTYLSEALPGPDQHPSYTRNGGTRLAAEQRMLQEWRYFYQNTLRWRDLRKITIAQVHGSVWSAGLMLMWACDLIVAAEGTVFADVVGTRLGMCGVEYFAHPWELGPRRAKELMLTGDAINAEEAHRIGMVSRVVPEPELEGSTTTLARRIAALPTMTALLIKESVNRSVDNMGFQNALAACFSLHQVNHAHWAELHDDGFPAAREADGIVDWRAAPMPQMVSQP